MEGVGDGVAAGVLAFCGSVWVGGYVTVVVVNRVARRALGAAERVAFFRSFGRAFGSVSTLALLLALASGGYLVRDRPWTPALVAAVVVAAAILVATGVGVAQARAMTHARRALAASSAAGGPDDALAAFVDAGARRAALLRAVIGGLSIALLALVIVLAR